MSSTYILLFYTVLLLFSVSRVSLLNFLPFFISLVKLCIIYLCFTFLLFHFSRYNPHYLLYFLTVLSLTYLSLSLHFSCSVSLSLYFSCYLGLSLSFFCFYLLLSCFLGAVLCHSWLEDFKFSLQCIFVILIPAFCSFNYNNWKLLKCHITQVTIVYLSPLGSVPFLFN